MPKNILDMLEAMMQSGSIGYAVGGIAVLILLIVCIVRIKSASPAAKAKKRKKEKAQKEKERKNRFRLITSEVDSIDGMEGHDFEQFCARLLMKNGFENVLVTQGSGDQGVDILAEKDDIRYAIQCKNYASKLGNSPVQEIYAGKVFYHCHVGAVMTNSTFTQSAMDLAEATNVILWDRDRLQEFMDEAE